MRYLGGKSKIAHPISQIINPYLGGAMQYQGGKSKISKPISEIITPYQNGRPFVSLFCGSCAVESKITGYSSMICNDKQPYLIALLRACQAGYIPPESVTEEEWCYTREHLDENPALSGFMGFGCSFGGKWFGGFARSKDRSYARESKNSLLRDMQTLDRAFFTNLDYRDVPIQHGSVVYADPPYAGTTQYNHETFDSEAFWEYMRLLANRGGVSSLLVSKMLLQISSVFGRNLSPEQSIAIKITR